MRKRVILLSMLAVVLSGLALLHDARPVAAYDVYALGCGYGQGCQAIIWSGPGSIAARTCGTTIEFPTGPPFCTGWAGNYCPPQQAPCAFSYVTGGAPSVAWYMIETLDESWSDITTAWCTGTSSNVSTMGAGTRAVSTPTSSLTRIR